MQGPLAWWQDRVRLLSPPLLFTREISTDHDDKLWLLSWSVLQEQVMGDILRVDQPPL